jgi:hypothetical protein
MVEPRLIQYKFTTARFFSIEYRNEEYYGSFYSDWVEVGCAVYAHWEKERRVLHFLYHILSLTTIIHTLPNTYHYGALAFFPRASHLQGNCRVFLILRTSQNQTPTCVGFMTVTSTEIPSITLCVTHLTTRRSSKYIVSCINRHRHDKYLLAWGSSTTERTFIIRCWAARYLVNSLLLGHATIEQRYCDTHF